MANVPGCGYTAARLLARRLRCESDVGVLRQARYLHHMNDILMLGGSIGIDDDHRVSSTSGSVAQR